MSVNDNENIEVKAVSGILRLRFALDRENAGFHFDLYPSEAEELADMLNTETAKLRQKEARALRGKAARHA